MRKILIPLFIAFFSTSLVGCGKAKINVESFNIEEESITIKEDEKYELNFSIEPENLIDCISWVSADINIATVDSGGKIKGVKAGETIIKASIGNFTDTCVVYVKEKKIANLISRIQTYAKNKINDTLEYNGVFTLTLNTFEKVTIDDTNYLQLNTTSKLDNEEGNKDLVLGLAMSDEQLQTFTDLGMSLEPIEDLYTFNRTQLEAVASFVLKSPKYSFVYLDGDEWDITAMTSRRLEGMTETYFVKEINIAIRQKYEVSIDYCSSVDFRYAYCVENYEYLEGKYFTKCLILVGYAYSNAGVKIEYTTILSVTNGNYEILSPLMPQEEFDINDNLRDHFNFDTMQSLYSTIVDDGTRIREHIATFEGTVEEFIMDED